MVLCRLHIMDLGIFDRLKSLTLYFLNDEGIITYYYITLQGLSVFRIVLKSDCLLLSNGHRLRKPIAWKSKWNGDDVSKVLPFITSLWYLVLRPQHLKKKFSEHIQSLSAENKQTIFEKYALNISHSNEGKLIFKLYH